MCAMDFCGAFSFVICITGILAGSQMTEIKLFQAMKTWNDAVDFCKAKGMSLLEIRTPQKEEALRRIKDTNIWQNEMQNFWIALHDPNPSNSLGYSWVDGCDPHPDTWGSWFTNEPLNWGSDKCIKVERDNFRWRTGPCNQAHMVMCEHEVGPCNFETVSDKRLTLGGTLQNVASLDECKTACLNKETNPTGECWAVTYTSDNKCFINGASDMFFYDNAANLVASIGTTVYIKRCFQGGLDKTQDSSVVNNVNEPDTGCIEGESSRITTTTTASTTTTTTTTTTSTTSTTTTTMSTSTTSTSTTSTTTSTTSDNPTTSTTLTTTSPTTPSTVSTVDTSSTVTTTSVSTPATSTAAASSIQTTVTTDSTSTTTATTAPPSTTRVTTGLTATTMTTNPSSTTTTTDSSTTTATTNPSSTTATTNPSSTTTTTNPSSTTATTDPSSTTTATTDPSSTTTATTDQSSTTTFTTDQSSTTASAGSEVCGCRCGLAGTVTIEERLLKIVKELLVDKKTTSKSIRAKTSAPDERPSAQNIGYSGVALMVVTGLLIILGDADRFFSLFCKGRR